MNSPQYLENYSPSSQPPPYEINTEEPLLKWGIILKTFLIYFTPYELSRGPMLVCRAWYKFLSSHLYTTIHLYSHMNYIAFKETLVSTPLSFPSSSASFTASHVLTHLSFHLTSLHLHGEHWESALGLSTMLSSHQAFQPSWLCTLFHSLPFLQTLELDSVPFLNDACVDYLCQHLRPMGKENEKENQNEKTTKKQISSASSSSSLKSLKSLSLTDFILKKPLLLSSVALIQFFTFLSTFNVQLTHLALIDCPALDATFVLQVQCHHWWGWNKSLKCLNLSHNPYSLTAPIFHSLFHPSQFRFFNLTWFSIAHSTSLPFPCVNPFLIASPLQHVIFDELRSWQAPFAKDYLSSWHSLSMKNTSLFLMQHVLSLSMHFTSLTCLTVSVTQLLETLSLWSPLFSPTNSTSIPFPKLTKLIMEDSLGDGIPLTFLRQLMGVSQCTRPFAPFIQVIQPRIFRSYLDSLLTHENVPSLIKESQGQCFLCLIERNTVTTW